MNKSRRKFITGVAITGVAAFVAPKLFFRPSFASHSEMLYINTLAIPKQNKGKIVNGVKVFDLDIQEGSSQFFKNFKTPTYGINADYLGPVILVNKGDKVRFNISNSLDEDSTVHWHGVHLPAKMDGGPHQAIEPGATWTPEFEIRQDASTLWFHSHAYHKTAKQVYMGLAGLLYVNDNYSSSLNIPSEYGVDDLPVVIQDRDFKRDGSFYYSYGMHTKMNGMKGEYILVNGTFAPVFNASKQLTRLRLLNGSNARIYNLAFSDGRTFKQIATDGGFLEKPVNLSILLLAPGERAEIVVELSAKDDVMLINSPSQNRPSGGMGMMGMMGGRDKRFSILRLKADDNITTSQPLPTKFRPVRNWNPNSAVKKRKFVLRMGMMGSSMTINGSAMDMNKINEVVKLNDIEIWEFENRSSNAHPIHIHDIQFRILDKNRRSVPKNEQGLKDTVLIEPRESVSVITQFENFADDNAPYMYHCHILEHEDAGMMGQFIVTNNPEKFV